MATNGNPRTDDAGALEFGLLSGTTNLAHTLFNSPRQVSDDIETRVFASLIRTLIGARTENKLAVFGLIGREAAACADRRRRQIYADCLWVAAETGLTELVGTVTITDTLMAAFTGRAE
jgi:hypothetical protein